MAVRIRLRRVGSKKNPVWRIVVADKRSPRDGRTIETIVEHLSVPGWLSPGATVSIERPVGSGVRLSKTFRTGWERTFGDTLVVFVEASDAPA